MDHTKMNAPIPCSDDVPSDPSHNQYQTGREVTPAQIQAAAPAPSDLQTDAVRIPPQAPGGAAPHPNAAGDGRGGGNPDTIVIEGKDGCIKATGLVANLQPGVNFQMGLNNTMNIHHDSKGRTTTTFGTSSGISSGINVPNKIPITRSQTIPNEQQLRDISQNMSGDWRRLGNRLTLKEPTLDQVNMDNYTMGVLEVIYQMLRKWKEMCYPATLQILAQALADIGRGDLADRVSNMGGPG